MGTHGSRHLEPSLSGDTGLSIGNALLATEGRMKRITPPRRSEIARLGAAARWAKYYSADPKVRAALGRLASKGRMKRISPERRAEIAKIAAVARWAKHRANPKRRRKAMDRK